MKTLKINTIFTFHTPDADGETQLIDDIEIPLGDWLKPFSCGALLTDIFFPNVALICKEEGKDVGDLCKISTCANWGDWEEFTGLLSREIDCGNGKWYFNLDVNPDLCAWELHLMERFGFGANIPLVA